MLSKRSLIAISFTAIAVGFLSGLWPLCIIGILLAALSGRWVTALLLGILLDVAYGVPTGILQVVRLPFTIFAALSVLGYLFFADHLRKKEPDTL